MNQSELLQLLDGRFNQTELQTVCFELGVDYDNLEAQGKKGKARELITFLDRNGRLPQLLDYLQIETDTIVIPAELRPYLQTTARRNGRLPLGPLDPAGRESSHISLGQVFVNLNSGVGRLWPDKAYDAYDYGEYESALAHIHEIHIDLDSHKPRQLILLGDAGSGKSTLLRFLSFCLANAHLFPDDGWLEKLKWSATLFLQGGGTIEAQKVDTEQHWTAVPPIPILLNLRHFARTDFDPQSPLALWQFVERQLGAEEMADAIPHLQAKAKRGQVIFLLDGVDEVPMAERPSIWRAINSLSRGIYGGNRWVATCRILSFDAGEAPAAVPVQTLRPLDDDQIDQFIASWYGALAEAGELARAEADAKTDSLQQASRRPRLQPLARNPMLLTIMALVQTYYGSLPDERAKLYQACVETLLLRWQRHKERGDGDQLPGLLAQLDVSQEDLERLLRQIAWDAHSQAIHRQDAADIDEMAVLQLARQHLGSFTKAEQFLEYTERRAHLLLGRGGVEKRVYTFPHRTFQEYLAACHLASLRRFPREAAKLAAQGDAWREVLNLAAGTLVFNWSNREKALDGVERVLPRQIPEPQDEAGWYRVWLAAEMMGVVGREAAEKDEVGREILPNVQAQLAALVATGRLTPRQRAEAGVTLGWLGDPRPDVACQVPFMVDIPAGPFLMGSDKKQDKLADDDEEPQHTLDLPAYRIGKYPVTVAQYGRFVEAGGYHESAYWTEAGWAQRQQDGWTEPRLWQEPRWTVPNHPVVGVSWYEAVAYCNWLTATTGRTFRLPDEAMWEKAARGTDGRLYPWGDEFDANRLNVHETGIGQTSAVGMFPDGRSPFDLYDTSGNVREWCSSRWWDENRKEYGYPYSPDDGREDLSGGDGVWRLLRGGSWYNDKKAPRCAARYWVNPSDGYDLRGFRCCCATSSLLPSGSES